DKSKSLTQSAISSNYAIFLSNINDLNKRLGELRTNQKAQGGWGRIFNGLSTSNRGEEVKNYSTNIQAGYDIALGSGSQYIGVALSYGYNVLQGENFDGKAQMAEIGAYYSYVGEKGFYTDSILKYAFIYNKLSISNNQNQNTNLSSSAFSFGQEVGYRWDFDIAEKRNSKHSIYLEPQAEVILGYVGNGGFDQINGNAYLNSNINNIFAFRARVGGVVGYSLRTASNQTDFRLGLSYVGDMISGGKIDFITNFAKEQTNLNSNQMAMLSLGVNSAISSQWKVYADLDAGFLGKYYNQNYLISVGGRYSFGKVLPHKASTIKQQNLSNQNNNSSDMNSSIPEGYYWVVYSLPANSKLSQQQIDLLSKYPYKIQTSYEESKDNKGKIQKVLTHYYLLGGFKTKEGAMKNQSTADQITQILSGDKSKKAVLKGVK
ncbi:autotransporter outer membrane beta-barrel domain-containing protein, partial [Helicobacter sp. 13S00477-4]|uniref:autotransporter outer membrane beta-barrel domain-containing protein n=1 Tax=Helicobacter sp. 13S00477-4 TaxID=1905759 RepID=UPI00117ADF94